MINAGLYPKLSNENYLPIRVRLEHGSTLGYNTQIIQALQAAITAIDGEIDDYNALTDEEIVENESLWNFLFTSKFWSKTNHQLIPVVFIDQFEEIFTKNEGTEKIVEFFDTINSLQYNRPPEKTLSKIEEREGYVSYNDIAHFRLVLSLREDFLPRLEDYSYNIPALRKNRKGIKQMNGYQALDVILKPFHGIITREDALLILEKVTGIKVVNKEKNLNRMSVDTSILSLFCSELYLKAVTRNVETISKELIEEFGDNIISSFYNETMKNVSIKSVEYLETHLLTHSGFRNSMAKEDLLQNGIKEKELEHLSEKRLVRIETFENVERVEFTHDVLCSVAKQHRDLRLNKGNNRINNILNCTFIIETCLATFFLLFLFICQYAYSHENSFHISLLRQCPPMLISCALFYVLHIAYKAKGNFRTKIKYLLICIALVCSLFWTQDVELFNFRSINYFWHYQSPKYKYIIGIAALIGTMGMFLPAKKKCFIVRQTTKYSTYILILLMQFFHLKIYSLALFLYVLYILSASCYSKDKRLSYFLIPTSILFTYPMTFLSKGLYENDTIMWSCLIFMLLIFCKGLFSLFVFKKRIEISIKKLPFYGLRSIISSPWKRVLVFIQFVIIVSVISLIIGWSLSDFYTLIATPILSVLCLILGCFAVYGWGWKKDEFAKFIRGNAFSIPYFKPLCVFILCMAMVAVVLLAQYFPYHTYIQLSAWTIGTVIFILFIRKYIYQGKSIFITSLLWLFTSIVIPILCMGYNPFVLPKYARIYEGRINKRPITRFIKIKDTQGNIGLRDRDNLIIPVENKHIELVDFRCSYYGEGLPFIYNIEKEDYRDKYYDESYSYHLNEIEFMVITSDNKNILWKCSEHLEDKNVCSIMLKGVYKKLIENATARYWNTNYLDKYLTHVNISPSSKKDELLTNVFCYALREEVEELADTLKNKIEFNNFREIRKCAQNIPSSTFANCIDKTYGFYKYYSDNKIPMCIVDTLYPGCKKNSLDKTDARTKAKWYIESKDYNKAIQFAKMSIQKNSSIHNYAQIILARASYLNGNYDVANKLVNKSGDETCFLNSPYQSTIMSETELYNAIDTIKGDDPYTRRIIIGDAIYNLIQFDKNNEALVDTNSIEFDKLMNSLKKYSRRPSYDYAEKRQIGDKMYYICRTYDSHGRILKYIITGDKQITPRFERFDGELVWGYSPLYNPNLFEHDIFTNVICEDGKRRFIKYSTSKDSVYVLPGSYDHIWNFSEGYAVVMIDDKMGVVDEEGLYVLTPQFHANIIMPDCYNRPKEMTECNWWNWENNIISSKNPNFIFTNGTCPMYNQKTGKYGRINIKGEWIQ